MAEYADLQVSLSRQVAGTQYTVELRFSRPDDQAERTPQRGQVTIDPATLPEVSLDPKAYGRRLKDLLFADPELVSFYKESLANTEQDMRIRLLIDRSALGLQNLRWETLRDPDDQGFIAADQNLPFSRFLSSPDWRRVDLRPETALTALVAVSGPRNLNQADQVPGQTLAEVRVEDELVRARDALASLPLTELASQAAGPGQVTLPALGERLQDGYDILYLVCHGAMLSLKPGDQPRPYLVLENESGDFRLVDGEDLVTVMRDLPDGRRPLLVVLVSCQSAGTGSLPDPAHSTDRGALAALGPRLVEAGVPAVIAMQGDILMNTAGLFLTSFFRELLRPNDGGRIDRAMAAARGAIWAAGCPDWWVPVLYLRLRGGRLWYKPGFTTEDVDLPWHEIVDRLQLKPPGCVPVLGPGLLDPLIGPVADLARRWARDSQYPLAAHNLEDMPQVAQYLAVSVGAGRPRAKLLADLQEILLRRCATLNIASDRSMSTGDLFRRIAEYQRQQSSDPYRILASLPFTMYISANPDNLLEEALRAAQPSREPQVLYLNWNSELSGRPENVRALKTLQSTPPTVERPLVYHLLGSLEDRNSLVLTEDDFFEYLMSVGKPHTVPDVVVKAWANSALLFLGFRLSDWSFRVMFRSILNADRRAELLYRSASSLEYHSVAVQIEPGDDNLRPASARRYLERYFPNSLFSIYWGTAEAFVNELWTHWPDRGS